MSNRTFTLICTVLVILCLYSCEKKKNWNCTCTVTGSPTAPNGATYTTSITDATNSNAQDLCNKWGANQIASGVYDCKVAAQ